MRIQKYECAECGAEDHPTSQCPHTPGGEYLSCDRLERGDCRIDWDELGEGLSGEYHPDDPDDVELLRFTVYRRTANPDYPDGWQPVDDASYCTLVRADIEAPQRLELLNLLMDVFHDPVVADQPVKKLGERMSWINRFWTKEKVEESK